MYLSTWIKVWKSESLIIAGADVIQIGGTFMNISAAFSLDKTAHVGCHLFPILICKFSCM